LEALTEDELAYHQRVAAQLRTAQAAWESWARHLAEKYRLSSSDSISEQGDITRASGGDESGP
jgi:hypothetical protein